MGGFGCSKYSLISEAANEEIIQSITCAETKQQIRCCSRKYSGCWLLAASPFAITDAFSVALQLRLGWTPRDAATTKVKCVGCNFHSSPKQMETHVLGCSHIHGVNVSTRHNALKIAMADLCRVNGLFVKLEPGMASSSRRADLAITSGSALHLVDLTIVNTKARSYQQKTMEEIEQRKEEIKRKLYGKDADAMHAIFHVFHVDVLGGFSNPAAALSKWIAQQTGTELLDVIRRFATVTQRWNSMILLNHRARLHLATLRGQ